MSQTHTITDEGTLAIFLDRVMTEWRAAAKRRKPLVVTLSQWDAPATLAQRRMYWKLIRHVASHAVLRGQKFSAEHWDEFYKRQYLGMEEIDGEAVAVSAAGISAGELSQFIEFVSSHAASELGIDMELN